MTLYASRSLEKWTNSIGSLSRLQAVSIGLISFFISSAVMIFLRRFCYVLYVISGYDVEVIPHHAQAFMKVLNNSYHKFQDRHFRLAAVHTLLFEPFGDILPNEIS